MCGINEKGREGNQVGGPASVVAAILEAKTIVEREQTSNKPLPVPRRLTGE